MKVNLASLHETQNRITEVFMLFYAFKVMCIYFQNRVSKTTNAWYYYLNYISANLFPDSAVCALAPLKPKFWQRHLK